MTVEAEQGYPVRDHDVAPDLDAAAHDEFGAVADAGVVADLDRLGAAVPGGLPHLFAVEPDAAPTVMRRLPMIFGISSSSSSCGPTLARCMRRSGSW
jgi:hypothetical protein